MDDWFADDGVAVKEKEHKRAEERHASLEGLLRKRRGYGYNAFLHSGSSFHGAAKAHRTEIPKVLPPKLNAIKR